MSFNEKPPYEAMPEISFVFKEWLKKLLGYINAVTVQMSPGMISPYAGSSIPTGYLACDGASLLRASYPDLFTAIGTTWGSADGTHFNVPDFRGRTLIGDGTGSGLTARTLAGSAGTETHQLTVAELAAHTHTHNAYSNTGAAVIQGGLAGGYAPATINNAGSDNAHNNMQPYKVVKYLIKT